MKRQDFYFDLPSSLIAQTPTTERTASRLLCYDRSTKRIDHRQFHQINEYLKPGDLLVLNDTKVIPARMYAVKDTGGKVELLVERVLGAKRFVSHLKASKAPKPGSRLFIDGKVELEVVGRRDSLFVCELVHHNDVFEIFSAHGHMPLPPYIDRAAEANDSERYQTVFAKKLGAIAAPTAGLHFDKPLLDKLSAQGVEQAYLTLHVGAGTFQPVREEDVQKHKMHSEWIHVPEQLVNTIQRTKARGGRVIAVGTTVVRALETAALTGVLLPFEGETDIFLYPGKPFHVIDGMVTNFHLPESTLLMLVAAFIGQQDVLSLYQEAIAQKYRFFSYGDASLLL